MGLPSSFFWLRTGQNFSDHSRGDGNWGRVSVYGISDVGVLGKGFGEVGVGAEQGRDTGLCIRAWGSCRQNSVAPSLSEALSV